MSTRVRQLLGLLIGLGLLAALLVHTGLSGLRAALQGLPPWLWLAAPALLLASHGLRAARIHAELSGHGALGIGACLRIGLLHSAAVNLLPLRGGELAYPWLVHRYSGIGRLQAAVSLLRMRGQDMVVLGSLALLCMPWWPWSLRCLAVATLLALVALLLVQGRRWATLAAGAPAPQWRRLLHLLVVGGRGTAWGWGFSVASWSLKLMAIGIVLAAAAGAPAEPAFRGALAGELSALWPLQAPAGLGTYEAAVWLATAWPANWPGGGGAEATVVGAALLAHAVVWVTTLGAAGLAWLTWTPAALAVPALDRIRSTSTP